MTRGAVSLLGLIFASVLFIFFVSLFASLPQYPKRAKYFNRYIDFQQIDPIRYRENSLARRRIPIPWCSRLHFFDYVRDESTYSRPIYKRLETFPGHLTKEKRLVNVHAEIDPDNILTDERRNRRRDVIALASFPGSGNTWLRYLLQQATGIFTGSIYRDFGLLQSGFPAEKIANSSVLVVKTHEFGPQSYVTFDRAILLVRDPTEAIQAEFNRQSGGHIGFAPPENYERHNGKYWQQFVTNKLVSWEKMNLGWAQHFPRPIKIVFYHDLVENLENELRGILRFISYPVDEDLLRCALERREGIYRRKKKFIHADPFSDEMHSKLNAKRDHIYSKLRTPKAE